MLEIGGVAGNFEEAALEAHTLTLAPLGSPRTRAG